MGNIRAKSPRGHRRTPNKGNHSPEVVSRRRLDFWICLLLLLATFAVYAPVRSFDFVNFDDPEYVRDNPQVRAGITVEGVKWALTTGESANWFPVTRLSHMADVQMFGVRSGPHHLVSVLIHALAALCLFAFLLRATNARWLSALTALIFAVHPLHVESVAWVAERKDVICACFWFLALWAYVRYAEHPDRSRYLMVLLPFCLGLMAKPMIVTLPVVLLLLDIWPLRRRGGVWEKVPFFALSIASALATYLVQQSSGAVRDFAAVPFGIRLENALVSYAVYFIKTVWPAGLAAFYPYPAHIPAWQPALAAAAVAGFSMLAWRTRKAFPYLLVGWVWYLVTLAPVIGLVQVGGQSRADRYMYVPLVGLALGLIWGAAEWFRARIPIRMSAAIAALVVLSLAVAARAQVEYWKNSESLFEHALAVTGDNYVAQYDLGAALAEIPDRSADAIAHYRAALRLQPDSAKGHTDLANILAASGQLPEAVSEYQTALRLEPGYASAHNNFGNALSRIPGRLPEAVAEYQAALRNDPENATVHNNLGTALAQLPGRQLDAIREFRVALAVQPDYAEAHANLANVLASFPDRLPEAVGEYEAALRRRADSAELHNYLALALSRMEGRRADAIAEYEKALRLQPDYAEAHNNLGVALLAYPDRISEAIEHFETALRINPDYAEAHYNLGGALAGIPGRMPEAISELETAFRLRPDPKVKALVDRLRSGGR